MKLSQPKPRIPPSLQAAGLAEVLESGFISGARVTGILPEGLKTYSGLLLEGCELVSLDLSTIVAPHMQLRDSVFLDCLLAGSGLEDSELDRVRFERCQMSGVDLLGSELEGVVFQGCILASGNFRAAKLKNVSFEDCRLDGADFSQAELESVLFAETTLPQARFVKATLRNVDLRTSEIGLIGDLEFLSGATITELQSLELCRRLAETLGLRIARE